MMEGFLKLDMSLSTASFLVRICVTVARLTDGFSRTLLDAEKSQKEGGERLVSFCAMPGSMQKLSSHLTQCDIAVKYL
jgi:hypothetical protein